MKIQTLLLGTVGILAVAMLGAAPSTINYQGVLTDADGNPSEGSNEIIVQLYSSDTPSEVETSLYSQSFAGVQSDSNGIYSIQIGDSNGTLQVILESYNDLWLELTINNNTLSPRHKVNAVPYALHAESANRLINAESSNISGSLSVSGTSSLSEVTVSGDTTVYGGTTMHGNVTISNNLQVLDSLRVMDPMTGETSYIGDEMEGNRLRGMTRVDSLRATEAIADSLLIYDPESGEDSYIGRDPISGDFGYNRLRGNTTIDDLTAFSLNVSGGSATLDSLRVMDPATGETSYIGDEMEGNRLRGMTRVDSLRAEEAITDFLLIYDPESGEDSYIGRDPISGAFGYNRLRGNTTIDNLTAFSLNVSGGSATLDSLRVMDPATGETSYIGDEMEGNRLRGMTRVDSLRATEAIADSLLIYDPESGEDSYIGRDPISGDFGYNRLRGNTTIDDLTTSSLNVGGDVAVGDDLLVMDELNVSGGATLNGNVLISGNVSVSDDLYISDGLYVSGPADFSYSSEVRVPTPDQDDEAANKSYVDSAISTEASSRDAAISDAIAGDNARGLVQLAVTENVANLSEYYLSYEGPDGLTNPAQGDLILLTAQTTTSENGIYEVSSVTSTYDSNQGGSGPTASDYYVTLARASGFDSSEEFITGSFVFVEKGSQVGQGYVLGELASDFALGTSPVNYLQFTVDTTKDVTFDQSVSSSSLASSGDLTVSGNSSLSNVTVSGDTTMNGNATMNGNTTIDGNVNLSGILDAYIVDANELYVQGGPAGYSRIDGIVNRIRGDILELDHMDTYISGDVHMTDDLNVSDDLYVSDGLYVSGPVDFSYSSEVRVPTPDQDDEAANKSYVDSAISTEASSRDAAISDAIAGDNARGLVQLAVTENVANLSEYYLSYEGPDGLTNPAQGDLILLTAQTTTSENGIYEVSSVTSTYDSNQGGSGPTASDYYVTLARASGFDSSEEFITGSFVFVEKGSQVGQGYVLGELASDFALGTSPVNYLQFTVDTTKDVTFDQSVSSSSLASSGDLTVSGNSSLSNVTVTGDTTMNGNATMNGNVNLSGVLDAYIVDANELYVQGGPAGYSRIDGMINRIRGDTLELNHMDTYITGNVVISDALYVGGPIDFSYSSEVRVPTPDQDDEAANKSYVDNLVSTSIAGDNARGLVQLAVTENVANLSEYYLSYEGPDGLANPAQGDLILLTGQTTTSENGIYEVSSVNLSSSYTSSPDSSGPTASDYYVSLARASGFDSSEEFITGSFVFVEKGSQVGQGYVLGELASDFALGTSPVNYLQFTVDTTKDVTFDQSVSSSSLASSGDLTVSGNSSLSNVTVTGDTTMNGNATMNGNVNLSGVLDAYIVDANELYVQGGPAGYSRIDGMINRIRGDILELNHMDTYITGNVVISDALYVSGPVDFSYSSEVRVPTPDQDDEAANKSYVDSAISTEASSRDAAISDAIAGDNARGLVQLAVTENVANLSEYYLSYEGPDGLTNPAQGDLILLTAQTTTSENGIYEVSSVTSTYDSNQGGSGPTASDYYVSLARASGFDSSEEFITGSFVFVEKGSQVGQGYVLGELASDFALGTSPVNYLQFTVDTTKDVTFEQSVSSSSLASSGDLTVSGNSSLSNVTVSGDTTMNGNTTIDGDVNLSGILDAGVVDAELLYVSGYMGSSQIDGFWNRIRGDTLELDHIDTAIGGNVSISGNTSMNGNVTIANDLIVSGEITASSDVRLKKNIKTIPNALEKVQQLRGVEFEFTDSGKDSVGLIAQEVENVIPQVVLTTEHNNLPDMKSVNYASLVGVLVEAIKEQQLQIDDLKAQVSLLEAANNMNE